MKKIYKKDSNNLAESLEELNQDITKISEEVVEEKNPLQIARKEFKKEKQKKRKSKWIVVLGILLGFGILLIVGLGYYSYLLKKGEKSLLGTKTIIEPHNDSQVSEDGSKVNYRGVNYDRNDNIVSFLIMGVDDIEGNKDSEEIGNKGQADTILYGTLDVKTGELNFLNISRDSMTDVDLFDTNGNFVETAVKQICLAYAYGDGSYKSCENVENSASRLMFGVPVDFYVAIDFPAVSVLTDAVDGVTVEVLEDLSKKDAALKKGDKVTLNGKQSLIYVRSRDFDTLDSNNSRMQRQKQYIIEFLRKLQSILKAKPYMVLNIYQAIQEYTTTNLDLSEVLYLANLALGKEIQTDIIKTVEGEVVEGEGDYAEFYVDKDKLYSLLLNLLYIRGDGVEQPLTESEALEVETEESLQKVDFSLLY